MCVSKPEHSPQGPENDTQCKEEKQHGDPGDILYDIHERDLYKATQKHDTENRGKNEVIGSDERVVDHIEGENDEEKLAFNRSRVDLECITTQNEEEQQTSP